MSTPLREPGATAARHVPGTAPGRWRWLLPALGILLWTAWVVGDLVADLPPAASWTSELAALDQPYGWVLRVLDAVSGLLFTVWSVLLLRGNPWRRDPWRTVGLLAVLVFGLSTLADASLPLSCANSVDAACLAAERAGDLPWRHYAHSVSSSVAGTALLVASFVFVPCVWRNRPRIGALLLATSVASGLSLVWQLLCLWPDRPDLAVLDLAGLSQRVQLVATLVWWLGMAAAVWRHPVVLTALDPVALADRAPSGRGRGGGAG